MIKRFYAVRRGRKSNVIVKSWPECEKLVSGFSGAIYKGFAYYDDAVNFAESGDYGKNTPNSKPKAKKRRAIHDTPHWPCIMRGDYYDKRLRKIRKNGCIMRQGPVMRGKDYIESTDTSCPF